MHHAQRGVALAIVVWFIAGMSLLVAGIVSHARVDTHMAQLHVARAKVAAAGDGAVNLVMAELVTGKLAPAVLQGRQARQYRLGNMDVAVTLVATTALIDLNTAPAQLLAALFAAAAGLDEPEAQRLADNVVDWRRGEAARGGDKSGRGGGKSRSSSFVEIEDLLRVEGVNRTLLDAVREYTVAGSAARGGMNRSQVAQRMSAVLEKSGSSQRGALLPAGGRAADTAVVDKDARVAAAYRIDAVMQYGGRAWVRRRWVLTEAAGRSLLPWRMVRTESPRVIGG